MPHRPASHQVARHAAGLFVAATLALQGCADDPPAATPSSTGATAPSSTSPPSASPSPSPTPTPTPYELDPLVPADRDDWLTEVPEGIRLDVALPADGGDFTRGQSGTAFEFCEVEAFASDDDLDRAAVSASGPEYGEGRDLRVFADDRAADRFSRQVLGVLAACPEQVMGVTTRRHEVGRSTLGGDASFTVTQTFETDGLPNLGANWWEVVRVGNAILLTSTGGEYDPGNLDPGIRRHAAEVAVIVEEMCVFAAAPCPA